MGWLERLGWHKLRLHSGSAARRTYRVRRIICGIARRFTRRFTLSGEREVSGQVRFYPVSHLVKAISPIQAAAQVAGFGQHLFKVSPKGVEQSDQRDALQWHGEPPGIALLWQLRTPQ